MRNGPGGVTMKATTRVLWAVAATLVMTMTPVARVNGQEQVQSPFVHRDLYPEASEAGPQIAAALKQARQQHKRVLLVFGGNWCSDCVLLNNKLHDATNAPILARSYILLHVNVGHMDENVELAQRFGVPLTHGVPGVSVVTGDGKVVHAQPNGELGDVRRMDAGAVTQFLVQWKG